jgi:DNA-binding GntR family transcriptional regulator
MQATSKSIFVKASEKIHWLIEQDIKNGVLLPGDSIDESYIALKHKVSHTPIREALIKLQAQGLISSLPRGGMIVAKMSLQQLLSLWELLAELEGIAAKLACQRMVNSELIALKALHASSSSIVQSEDVEDWQKSNLLFHEIIYKATRNPYLRQEVLRLRTVTGYYRKHAFGALGQIKTSFEQHEEIINAIESRDISQAFAAMNHHMLPASNSTGLTNFIINIPQESLAA